MHCCGEDHTTKFCPHCGKCLWDDAFGEMLFYIHKQKKTAQTRIDKGYGKCWKRALERYTRWEECLLELGKRPKI
jgi:hypothetical protein